MRLVLMVDWEGAARAITSGTDDPALKFVALEYRDGLLSVMGARRDWWSSDDNEN